MKIFQFHRRRNLLLLMMLAPMFLAETPALAVKTADIGGRMKIYFGRAKDDSEKIQNFLKPLELTTSSIAGLDRKYFTSVILSEKELKNKIECSGSGENLRIYVSDDYSQWEKDFDVHCTIVSILLLNKYGLDVEKNIRKVPAWIPAGILSYSERRSKKSNLPGVITYPGIRALAISETVPGIWDIINNPLGYRDGPAYDIYGECCEIILASLMRQQKSAAFFEKLLKSAINGNSQEESFRSSMSEHMSQIDFELFNSDGNQLPADRKIEIWYEHVLSAASVNLFYPASSSFAMRRFNELETIHYRNKKPKKEDVKEGTVIVNEAKKAESGPGYCHILELPQKLQEMENPSLILSKQKKLLNDFLNQCPSVFHLPITAMSSAISNLEQDGDGERFKEAAISAQKKFFSAVKEDMEIEAYLNGCEKKFVPPGKLYSNEVDFLEKSSKSIQLLWPGLYNYLDKQGKVY